MKHLGSLLVLCFALILQLPVVAQAQNPFFSGAEGFGGTIDGTAPAGGWFSNATIYHVTTTEDLEDSNGKPAQGTLRRAFLDSELKQNGGNVIVVFDVGGTFELTQGKLDIKNISNYYVAGQTAPSPVTIYGNTTQITHSSGKETKNIALRYLSFRKGSGDGSDAVTFAGSGLGSHLIFDHLSASWAEDEILSVTNNNTEVSIQYSIMHDALVSNHAYGSLLRPKIDSEVSLHHNLYANNSSRQARFGTYDNKILTADFRNNVVYNWRDRASYSGGSSDDEQETANINYVGNYLVAGPNTTGNPSRAFSVDKNTDTSVYQTGNFIDPDDAPGGSPADGVVDGVDNGWAMFAVSTPVTDQTLTQLASPVAVPAVTTQSAPDAYNQVVDYVGNFWWNRDQIDSRVISNVVEFTGPATIGPSSPDSGELAYVTGAPTTTRPHDWDTDNDGMPNYWEEAHGLDPHSASDAVTYNSANPSQHDFDLDGYTNLQEYLDDIGAFPAPTAIKFNAATNARYAQISNWRTDDSGATSGSMWQPSRFDTAVIENTQAVVDAVGQHAGTVLVDQGGSLAITAGWLKIADTLNIGPSGAATVTLSGGSLRARTINKQGPDSSFVLSGGKLHADSANFELQVTGGTVAPGFEVGTLTVAGSVGFASESRLELELGNTTADLLDVQGDLNLGTDTALDIVPLEPLSETSYLIAQYTGARTGTFGNLDIPAGFSIFYNDNAKQILLTSEPISLPGDFNGDNTVDLLDYGVWRDALGSTDSLSGNGDEQAGSAGVVDHADYALWTAQFGQSLAGSLQFAEQAVPELSAHQLLLSAVALGSLVFRNKLASL